MLTMHDGLPQEGPGNRASTARALNAVGDLAWRPATAHSGRVVADYPDMTDLPGCPQRAAAAGYELLGHFVLPESAWWDDYYRPMEARLARLPVEFENDAQVMHLLQGQQQEIDVYRRWSEHNGYLFVVARRAD